MADLMVVVMGRWLVVNWVGGKVVLKVEWKVFRQVVQMAVSLVDL